MPLSWNEIKARAVAFSKEWKDESSEDAEAKSFWDDFFNVFGISRRRVATFEEQVHKIGEKTGYIDLLWKGVILIEHKSRGKDLDKAFHQAKDYFPGLKDKELPRYILVSDFARFRLYDLEEHKENEFTLSQLVSHIHLFDFIAGYQRRTYKEQDPVNIEAAELMGKLHDKLRDIGYSGHELEVYLVRLVFCLFADDTNIFEKGIFYDYLDLKTNEDGSDLAGHLAQIFEVLNTPTEKRLKNLDENLSSFPYVNGKLFEERLLTASFDKTMRKILLDCCLLDWGEISPAIFGSLFQSVMDKKARRNLGAHYTSEKNILKLIKPLFLDDLWKEFEKVKKESRASIDRFHIKISKLRFLDPACGCGNFLIITYRELRLLEIEVIQILLKESLASQQSITDIGIYVLIDVDKFYGIEYEEFPAQIAQVAMWLIDHQMNQIVSETFGDYYIRLPLKKSAVIQHGNSLQIDWSSLLESSLDKAATVLNYNFILGNPPFIGKKEQNNLQKEDMARIFAGVHNAGLLDYVSAWYIKAAQYLEKYQNKGEGEENKIQVAFVSTNSITMGEQVGVLWNELINRYKISIHFAHRTFSWSNESKNNAGVHVVIIGFSNYESKNKTLYVYGDVKGDATEFKAENINPYLVNGITVLLKSRNEPICNVPLIIKGSEATDDGNLQLSEKEKSDLVEKYPNSKKFIRPFLSGGDILNGTKRWCLWLKDVNPEEFRKIPLVHEKIEKTREFRIKSPKQRTREWAKFPSLFTEDRQPAARFMVLPKVSSERREYIPFSFLKPINVINNTVSFIADADDFIFGVLQSKQHMTWTWYVAGRMKSDIQYSNEIVYNNFPWPENLKEKQKSQVIKAAHSLLEVRDQFTKSSLAAIYDPQTMPPILLRAHQALDKAVDLCYRPQPFVNDSKRIEFLFTLYDTYTSGLFAKEGKRKK